MATEHYLYETGIQSDASLQQKWKSLESATDDESETNPAAGFDCNICLDLVRDPVVTFCGHLYCWPCIYKWISFKEVSPENPDQQLPQCPVCKAEVSQKTLIPLYGRGHNSSKDEDENDSKLGIIIPQRPSSPRCGANTLIPNIARSYTYRRGYDRPSRVYNQPGNYMAASPSPPMIGGLGANSSTLVDPMIGMFGEMVYARIFGNSSEGTSLYTYPNSYRYGGSGSPRVRRRMVQTDRSLSRVCFFLFCCVMLCLLLF